MSGTDRRTDATGDAATAAATSASVLLTGTVKLLAMASSLPLASTGGSRAALLVSGGTAVVELLARDAVARDARRRGPLLLLDLAAAGLVLALGGAGRPALLHSLGTAALAAALFGAGGVVVAATVGLGAAVLATRLPGDPLTLTSAAGLPGPYALVAVLLAAVRQLLATEVDLRGRLSAAGERAARAEERARLARDLHDSAAASVGGLRLAVDGLYETLSRLAADRPEPRLVAAAEAAGRARADADRALLEARLVVADLRVAEPRGRLDDAVRRTVAAWRGADRLAVELTLAPVPEPDAAGRAALLAALREALLNVDRHAGAAGVGVSLSTADDEVRLAVSDDGRGFAGPVDLAGLVERGHFGLAGTAERLDAAGGQLEVRRRPGGGTVVDARIVLTAAEAAVPR